jgi:aminocarboxymuconate-semialdehyde decarboxylase
MIIDVHAHFYPDAVLDFFRRYGGDKLQLTESDGDLRILFRGKVLHAMVPRPMYEVATRIAAMDANGVATHALSVPPPMVYWAEPQAGLDLCQAANESVAQLERDHPGRFLPVASVPLQAPELAAEELRRAVTTLGCRMVEIGTNINGVELDDPRLEPFYAEAEALDVGIFVHPIDPAGADRMADYRLDMSVGMVLDSTLAASRVVCSGLMDRHPGLRFSWSHLGGLLPFVADRTAYFLETLKGASSRAEQPFLSYFERFWYDTVVYSPRMLKAGLQFADPSRLMFGTDAPFLGDSTADIRRIIDGSPDLSAEQREAIYEGNARTFLKLPERASESLVSGTVG